MEDHFPPFFLEDQEIQPPTQQAEKPSGAPLLTLDLSPTAG